MDPLATAYLKIIEEETSSGVVDSTKSQIDKIFGDKESDKKAKQTVPTDSTEMVDSELEEVEEAPEGLTSKGATGELKSVKGESNNPFDALYNKVINEEMFDFSTEDNSLEPTSEMGESDGLEEFDDETEETEEDSVTFTLDRETAEKLHEVLMSVLDKSEEVEDEAEEDLEEIDELEDDTENGMENEVKEAIEAEIHGHALVDQEKLEKGMTKHSNMEVKGAVPVSKKKAEVVKGKKTDGTPEKCTDNPEELTSKSKMDTGGVRVGKSLFDQ
jgi:pilus assembly protein FimV